MRTEHSGQTQKNRRAGKRASSARDALTMLKNDHKNVLALFDKFRKMAEDGGDSGKAELVSQICNELKVHTAIEEEIFYPAVRSAIDEDLLMDEALVEHSNAKEAVEKLEGMEPGDERYDAMVCVLGEEVKHHAKEEEKEMFPKAKKAKMDLAALGEEMSGRKSQLMESMGS
ncbi:MAG TPA: hemerythrin domain-containing protein [Burkholderiales bacterium]|jgi:hemerythrin superfamily protein|nr:hemerythrin domain-containing protein [Burkholderiales bacterium]